MPEIIVCPGCQRKLRLPEEHLGREVRCPSCKTQFLPEAARPAPPPGIPSPSERSEPPDGADESAPHDRPRRAEDGPLGRRVDVRLRKPRGKRTAAWVVAGVTLGVMVFCLLPVVWIAWYSGTTPPRRVAVREDPEERIEEVREAFAPQKPMAPREIAQDVKTLFDDLGAAFQAADEQGILGHFDVDRVYDELSAQGGVPPALLRNRRQTVEGLRIGLGRSLTQQAPLLAWTATDVKNVKQLPAGEAVVIARHRAQNGASLKMRWWITRRSGAWKLYDFEELDTGIRFSTSVGAALAQVGGNNLPALRAAATATRHVREAMVAIGRQDPDAAEKSLRLAEGVRLPDRMESVRLLAVAAVRLQRGRFKECLANLDKARRLNPDMPLVDLLEGTARNRLGEWERALKRLRAYRDLLGDDAIVCRELGESLRGLNRFEEAAACYRKALDEDPADADAFLGLLHSLGAEDRRDDVPARFARLDDPRGAFETLAEECKGTQDFKGVEQLALAVQKMDASCAPADYYLALVRAHDGRADRAIALYRTALGKEKDRGKRESYTIGFLGVMATAGKALEAYAAAPDPREAFRLLAAELKKSYRHEDLRRLVAAHGKKHAADALVLLYRGELFAQDGNYRQAEEAFTAALAKRPDRGLLDPFRPSRVLARYHTGRALSAYAEIPPRDETYRQLVALCFQHENYPQLQALLDARTGPDDAETLGYRCRLKVRQKQVAEGLTLFRAALAKEKQEAKRKELVSEFLTDMAEVGRLLEGYRAAPDANHAFQMLAETLLEEDKLDDLRRLVDAHRQRHPDDAYLALYTGQLHLADKAWDRAARVFAEGGKKAPESLRGRFRSNYVLAAYRAGRGLRVYTEAEPNSRKEVFDQLANLTAADNKWADLEALVAARLPHAADDPDLLYHQARARAHSKRPTDAIPLFLKAYQKQTLDDRPFYARTMVLDLEEAGKGLAGYRAAPDRAAAFEVLAPRFVGSKKTRELERLLQEHGKTNAKDPVYLFYRGELALLKGDATEAGRQFAAALARAPAARQWMFRNGLYRARVRAGRAADAYREAGPGTQALEALAPLCMTAKDAGQLEAVIAAHRKARPDDPNLPAWDVDVKWLRGDYEGVLKLLAEHRDDAFTQPRLRWKYENYRVRCLVKLKRTEEAIREAEAAVEKDPWNGRLLLVLAHAAAGDVKRAIAAAEKPKPLPYQLRQFYGDADLGPILRGEPLRAFRERFPEPKEKEVAGD